MQRTDTTSRTIFHLPAPETATFQFDTPRQIQITVPAGSTWRTASHWHSYDPDGGACSRLSVLQGRLVVAYHKQPRTGGVFIGAGDYAFKPGYWTGWGPESKEKDLLVRLVADETMYRNICSAILDTGIYPYLSSTPLWLRGIFAALRTLSPVAYNWMLGLVLAIQIQAILYARGYWEYHGGVNALSWWQYLHPFDIGNHPAWTVKVQYKSQKLFSRVVQGLYYGVGRIFLGMRGGYPEYTPHRTSETSNQLDRQHEDTVTSGNEKQRLIPS